MIISCSRRAPASTSISSTKKVLTTLASCKFIYLLLSQKCASASAAAAATTITTSAIARPRFIATSTANAARPNDSSHPRRHLKQEKKNKKKKKNDANKADSSGSNSNHSNDHWELFDFYKDPSSSSKSSESFVGLKEAQKEEDAPTFISNGVDGDGIVTTCTEENPDVADFTSVDLEINFTYQIELLSITGKNQEAGVYDEIINSVERSVHDSIVGTYLDCDFNQRRTLTETMKSLIHIVAVGSTPKDVLSNTEKCSVTYSDGDACVVVNAGTTLNIEIDPAALRDSSPRDIVLSTKNNVPLAILDSIEIGMIQGQYDQQHGTDVFAMVTFGKRPAEARSNSLFSDAADTPIPTAATSPLRDVRHNRYPRQGVRFAVIAAGLVLVAAVFGTISYEKRARKKRRRTLTPQKTSKTRKANLSRRDNLIENSSETIASESETGSASVPSPGVIIIEDEESEDGNIVITNKGEDTFEENESIDDDSVVIRGNDAPSSSTPSPSQSLESNKLPSPSCLSRLRTVLNVMNCDVEKGLGSTDLERKKHPAQNNKHNFVQKSEEILQMTPPEKRRTYKHNFVPKPAR